MIAILGKSEATLTMIMDNLDSHKQYPALKIINNIDTPNKKLFLVEGFVITESLELGDEEFTFLGGTKVDTKLKLVEIFNPDIEKMINIFHKSAQISTTVKFGRGILINSLVSIGAYSEIGNYVNINRNSSVGHHTVIEDFCTMGPGTHIAGNVRIGRATSIGMGSIIRDGITIGENSVIGMGSVIVKDVPANTTVIQKK